MSKVFTITEGLENMGALKTGGQGSVYKARRIGPIITAVKLLPTPIHSESEQDKHYKDFQNEVAKLKRVSEQPNPNVVKILSFGITESGSLPYIEMEFIEGPDLEELLQPPHPPIFTVKECIKVADHLSNALAHCHRLGISHGDIKSNNVKFNVHTGNYVLLDFGLAIMSDEQRRTSLRHAGAIEFMAPEQNEGRMLPQTDVYAFGIILYELLAGQVPFPLAQRGESARNEVRLQHMEASVPDLLQLRETNMPPDWPADRKDRELQVPQWLLDMISKCLEKAPEARLANGVAIQEFLALHSMQPKKGNAAGNSGVNVLQQENEQLRRDKNELQKALAKQAETAAATERELVNLRVALTRKEREWAANAPQPSAYASPLPAGKKAKNRSFKLPMILAIVFVVGSVLYLAASNMFGGRSNETATQPTAIKTEQKKEPVSTPREVIGEFKVAADRAYFHNQPDEATRRSAYMVPSEDVIKALEEQAGFIYVEFTNSRGQTSKGWLKQEDMMPLTEWLEAQNNRQEPLTKIEINEQLQQARKFLNDRNPKAAFALYQKLSDAEVPEAMFEYGNRALKGEHTQLDCDAAYALVQKASDRDYTPAKRTIGFLYLFGQNKEVLRMSKYNQCTYERNIVKGTRLLMQAISEGDSTANEILTDFNRDEGNETDSVQ